MKCSKCGYELPAGSNFCQYCGEKLQSESIKAADKLAANDDIKINNEDTTLNAEKSNTNNITLPSGKEHKSKEKYCKKCGGKIDSKTNKCTSCGQQRVRVSFSISCIILSVVLLISIGANIYQFLDSKDKIQDLDELVAVQKKDIADRDKKIKQLRNKSDEYKKKADEYEEICSLLENSNIGYSSSNFNSSESIIILRQNEFGRKFTLTANWHNGGSVYTDYSSTAAELYFDNKSWNYSTSITVMPMHVGATVVNFSNSANSEEFKILIIVTD